MSLRHAAAKQLKPFPFGDNWAEFLSRVDDDRIRHAEECLKRMLEVDDLRGKTFIDVGSGSGLSSLAARRLGAEVFSFDCDPKSVACTQSLKQTFFPENRSWVIAEGSILDADWVRCLRQHDIVYAWGVLHHTGSIWQALANVDSLVNSGGKLFIAVYNDQGWASDVWRMVKRLYNVLPSGLRFMLTYLVLVRFWGPKTIMDLLRGHPFRSWRSYAAQRGMSPWHDLVDWVGGYPFEVATPEAIIDFYIKRGYTLQKLNSVGRRLGCNEFVFAK
jgi:2-polyprenyl-6-hydroxyphenyl methylase/3-demethylubiquinone-9 3-methyltransferase